MNGKERILIHIPADGNYIEILGFKIDGFKSFEAFCEHLKKYAELEEENNRLKDEKKCLVDSQINLQKILSEKIAERDSAKAEINHLKKLLAESEAKCNEAAKQFYKHGVKDFREKLKKEALVDCRYVILPLETIDTVSKDLAGDTE